MIQLYTIGFKEKPAQEFFELLKIHKDLGKMMAAAPGVK